MDISNSILVVILILIYIIDSNSPIFYIILTMLLLHFFNKDFPIFQVILIIICVYILVYMVKTIMSVFKYGCNRHRAGLMIERFNSETDSSIAYFKRLNKKTKSLDSNFDKSIAQIEDIKESFIDLKRDICYVLNQIDDGLEGNYASNVPDDEASLPADLQASRAKERKLKAKTYVTQLKKSYFKDTPIIECFSNEDDVSSVKNSLMEDLQSVQDKFTTLKSNLSDLKASISDAQIAIYNVSLGYNDKYLTKLLKMVTAKEGFMSEEDPVSQIENLESDYKPIVNEIAEIQKMIDGFKITINKQKEGVKQAKGPVTDPKIQAQTINDSYNANKKG